MTQRGPRSPAHGPAIFCNCGPSIGCGFDPQGQPAWPRALEAVDDFIPVDFAFPFRTVPLQNRLPGTKPDSWRSVRRASAEPLESRIVLASAAGVENVLMVPPALFASAALEMRVAGNYARSAHDE